MPLLTSLLLVRLPTWIILVPVSACWRWWVSATEWNSPVESSPSRTQLGYFHVTAEPVSTCVQVTLLRSPRHSARYVTQLSMPPPPSSPPASPFCPVAYTATPSSRAPSPTTPACRRPPTPLG